MAGAAEATGANAEPRLGALFPMVEVLPVGTRLELSERLAVSGSPVALLADDLRALPLPAVAGHRAAVRQAIEGGLGREELACLRRERLADIVPPIAGHCGEVKVPSCPSRLRSALDRAGRRNWSELGGATLDEIRQWPGVGPRVLSELVGAAVETGLSLLAPAERDEEGEGVATERPAGAAAELAEDLGLLLAHDRREGDGALDQALRLCEGEGAPEPVRAAARRLRTAAEGAVDPRLAALGRILAAVGDHRDRGVFEHCSLGLDERPAFDPVAEALGLTRERVRQLRSRVAQRAEQAITNEPGPLGQAVATVERELAAVAPLATADRLLASIGLPPRPDPRSLLLLWLAGPYHLLSQFPGWVARDDSAIVTETRPLLLEDGGVRPVDHVVKELEAAGVAPEHVEAWLEAQPTAAVEGLVVALTGSPADVAERVLAATGRAMAAPELVASVAGPGEGAPAGPALEAALRRDRRFVRVSQETFELAEWGSEPFTGQPLPFGPVGPEGVKAGGGRGPVATGRCWLRVEVDGAVLGGSSAPVTDSLVETLGLGRGGRRTFATRYGPVALRHDAGQPTRGSVRPVALAAGAGVGDVLVLGFDPAAGWASVELVKTGPSPSD